MVVLHSSTSRSDRRNIGRLGERIALRYLKRRKYRLLMTNLRLSMGEADIVCLAPDRRTIVIVEVKSRVLSGRATDRPAEAGITHRKRRTLRLLTHSICRRWGWDDRPKRIDVVCVDLDPSWNRFPWFFLWLHSHARVRHYEAAVGDSD